METSVFINMLLENMNDLVSDDSLKEMKRRLNILMDDYTVEQKHFSVAIRNNQPDAFKHFLVTKKIDGLSDTTLSNYKRVLETFFNRVTFPMEQITSQTILKYLYSYATEIHGESSNSVPTEHTIDQIRSVLSSFFGWCTDNGYIAKNPCKGVSKIKYQKKEIDVLTEDQTRRLLDATKFLKTYVEQKRAYAILEVFISTGVRVSELVNIKLSDIKWDAPVSGLAPVKVVAGKGNKDRTVFLTDEAGIAVLDYMQVRNSDSEYLFVRTTNGNGQITARTVQNIVSTLGNMIGVESCHPHMLRHSVATEMAQKGTSINLVQKMLGHSSSATTTEYYIKAEEKQLADEISKKLN